MSVKLEPANLVIDEPGDYVVESQRFKERRICHVYPSGNPAFPWVATDRGGYRQEFDSFGVPEDGDEKRVICKCVSIPPYQLAAAHDDLASLRAENERLAARVAELEAALAHARGMMVAEIARSVAFQEAIQRHEKAIAGSRYVGNADRELWSVLEGGRG